MKKTRYKACLLISDLDDDMILEAELANVPMRPRVGHVMKRILVIAACVAMLAVLTMSVFLLARFSNPGVTTDPSDTQVPPASETETVEGIGPSVYYLSEKSYVTVQYLVAGKEMEENGKGAAHSNTDTVQIDEVNARIGQRLILIHFTCTEGETITVTPTAYTRLLTVYRFLSSDGYVQWKIWNEEHLAYDSAEAFCSDWEGKPLQDIGQSVTVTEDTTLLWQYEIQENSTGSVLPCVEDNFVDFMVTDAQDRITGGGSIYIGGLDIAALTKDHTYYADNWVVYNSIYRPNILGSYRYHSEDGTPITEAFHNETVAALHASACEQRDMLFEDLSPDSPLFSMREFDPDHHKTFSKHHEGGYSWNMRNWIHRSQTMPYDLILLESSNSERRFLLYDFGYNEIAETVIEIDNGYGYMVKGYYVMVDGTYIYVDESTPEGFVIVPPAEGKLQ